MSVTDVGICNSALVKIGADLISSLTQTTRSAQLLNAIFAYIRDEVLREGHWKFARKRASLTPNSTTPAFEWTYTYDIPNDNLLIIGPEDESIEWDVEGTTILTNEPTLNIYYIYRCTDFTIWDSLFAEAMAWRLGYEVSYALTQSLPLRQDCEKMYKQVISYARSVSSTEGTMKGLIADTWTRRRDGRRDFTTNGTGNP